MDKYPWLLPVALVAAGIKCMLLYAGVISFGFGTIAAYFGLSWLQVSGIVLAIVALSGGYFLYRMKRYPDECPVPPSWFRWMRFRSKPEPAHARLVKADPAPNSTMERAPEQLTLWFGAPIQPTLSQVRLTDADGKQIGAGKQTSDASDATVLTVDLPKLAPGAYTVVWRTMAAASGQSVGGTFKFSVGEPLAVGTPASATQ